MGGKTPSEENFRPSPHNPYPTLLSQPPLPLPTKLNMSPLAVDFAIQRLRCFTAREIAQLESAQWQVKFRSVLVSGRNVSAGGLD